MDTGVYVMVHVDETSNITSNVQSELPPPTPRNPVESNHGCTSRIYFDNAVKT